MSKSQYDTSRLQSELSSVTEQLSLKRAESDKLSSLVQSLQTDNNRLTHQVSHLVLLSHMMSQEATKLIILIWETVHKSKEA